MGARINPGGPSLGLILFGAAVLRLAIFLTPSLASVSSTLERRPELSTPVSSFMVVKEALHLQDLYYSSEGRVPRPYDNGTLYLPPVLLAVLSPFWKFAAGEPDTFHTISAVLWTAADLLAGLLLARVYEHKQRSGRRRQSSAERSQLDAIVLSGSLFSSPAGAAAAYLFNPYTIATCLARSTTALSNLCIIIAVFTAQIASPLLLSIAVASAVLVSLYPVVFIPALVLLCAQSAGGGISRTKGGKNQDHGWSGVNAFLSTTLIGAALASGVYLSYVIAERDWTFLDRAYGTIVRVPDLSPNIGLWWYFFIEIFDHFRDFFLLTFNAHVAAYALPLTIKYASDPLFAVTALTGIIAMLKSYPTLGDASLFFAMLSLHREIAPYLRYPSVTTLLYVLATLMMPALHHLWLTAGSGNANFFYASTLIWALASGAAVLDAMWAWGRWRWESERPKAGVSGDQVTRRVIQK